MVCVWYIMHNSISVYTVVYKFITFCTQVARYVLPSSYICQQSIATWLVHISFAVHDPKKGLVKLDKRFLPEC